MVSGILLTFLDVQFTIVSQSTLLGGTFVSIHFPVITLTVLLSIPEDGAFVRLLTCLSFALISDESVQGSTSQYAQLLNRSQLH